MFRKRDLKNKATILILAAGWVTPAYAAPKKSTTLTQAKAPNAKRQTNTKVKSAVRKLASTPEEFKFPLILCAYKEWTLKNVNGKIKPKSSAFSAEQAYKVENIQTLNTQGSNGQMIQVTTGDFSGEYAIPNSAYRVRVEGKVSQGVHDGATHQLRLRSFLEKKDSRTGVYSNESFGSFRWAEQGKPDQEGFLWENVRAYAFNNREAGSILGQAGKVDESRLLIALRDGKVDLGTVVAAGPVCGLLDMKTAQKQASAATREKFKDIFGRFQAVTPAVLTPEMIAANSAKGATTRESQIEAPTAAPSAQDLAHLTPEQRFQAELAERAEQQLSGAELQARQDSNANQAQQNEIQQAQSSQPQPQPQADAMGQQMSPEVQAQLAQQEQLANQHAATYNFYAQNAQNGAEVRDPAAAQPSPQTPEQVQQQIQTLDQQRQALWNQQNEIEQRQYALMQRQQELANAPQTQPETAPLNGGAPVEGAPQASQGGSLSNFGRSF